LLLIQDVVTQSHKGRSSALGFRGNRVPPLGSVSEQRVCHPSNIPFIDLHLPIVVNIANYNILEAFWGRGWLLLLVGGPSVSMNIEWHSFALYSCRIS
jgi:hypothetical protein